MAKEDKKKKAVKAEGKVKKAKKEGKVKDKTPSKVKKDKKKTGSAKKGDSAKKSKKAKKAKKEDSDDDSEEEKPKKKTTKKKEKKETPKKKKVVKKESSDEDSDSEDEAPKKAAKKADSDDDDSDSDSEDEDTKKAAKKADSDDDDSDDDDSDDDSSSKKRKADDEEEEAPAKKAKSAGGESAKVFVGGLPWAVTEWELKDFFKDCGTIESVDQPVGDDGRSKGIAYVFFSDSSEAEKACELHGQELGGRWLKIEQASNRTERVYDAPVKPEGECYTIFIGNLSWSVDEDAIRSAFESCGTITSVRFATDRETGEFRGFGHVEFEEGDAAEKGVGMAGMDIGGRPVRCDYAQSRGGGGKGGASPGGKGKGGKGGFSPGGKGKGGKGKGKGKGKGGKGKGDAPQRQSSSVQAFAGKKQTFGDSDSD